MPFASHALFHGIPCPIATPAPLQGPRAAYPTVMPCRLSPDREGGAAPVVAGLIHFLVIAAPEPRRIKRPPLVIAPGLWASHAFVSAHAAIDLRRITPRIRYYRRLTREILQVLYFNTAYAV